VVTASNNILRGITREKVLGLREFNTKEAIITTQDLLTAREAFVTSTTKNILPVLEIDGRIIGNGRPGKISTEIFRKILALKGEAE
jgi:branched-subunit amino acid aminotransferase/4-amino-4-deoxychorismate lyase